MEASGHSFPDPVFVGGVGRSGTHAMGRLLAAHPRYYLIRTEARFHVSHGGLPDLFEGRTEMEDFLKRMRGYWWKRGHGQRQGLQRVADRDQLETALERFEAEFERDRWGAGGRLVRSLLDPAAHRDGKPSWVEVTGQTVEQAPFLRRLLPHAKFINMVRDGRAVVAGTLQKVDMTDDPEKALDRWERMVRDADAAIRAAPEGSVLTVHLDDLVALDRDATFQRVVEFLEIDDVKPMRRYFRRRISADAAHVGRWRERMAPADARRVDRRYRRLVRRLHREGVTWAPLPEDSRFSFGRVQVSVRAA